MRRHELPGLRVPAVHGASLGVQLHGQLDGARLFPVVFANERRGDSAALPDSRDDLRIQHAAAVQALSGAVSAAWFVSACCVFC